LQALTRKYSFELRIIGARDAEEYKIYASDLLKSFRGINIKLIPWTLETELYELSKFDIGLMPLTNGEKEKGKCGFKIIQYMAMGIPSVASNVGENVHIVTESVDGFLCSNSIDWINKLSILLDNADVRYQMGDSALKKAQEYYALEIRVKEISCLIHHLYVKSQKRVSH
jgi:glycosyltransferase involved in cell wall biosynthesis